MCLFTKSLTHSLALGSTKLNISRVPLAAQPVARHGWSKLIHNLRVIFNDASTHTAF